VIERTEGGPKRQINYNVYIKKLGVEFGQFFGLARK
jgi:hypothetical protein